MASNYPGSLDSFDTIASDKKTSDAVGGRTHRDMHNDLGDAIEAVQTELGTDPAGGSATVKARFDVIEANDWVTSARIAADAVGSSEIAANAVGSSELADNAVDTAAIADGAVTAAKFAVQPGNLLTDNQATGTDTLGDTTGFRASGATIASSTAQAYQGSRSLAITATSTGGAWGIVDGPRAPVTAGDAYTVVARLLSDQASGETAKVYFAWYTAASGGSSISSTLADRAAVSISSSGWTYWNVTAVAPATAAYAEIYIMRVAGANGAVTYVDTLSVHRGASGQWAMPGVPIVGGSHIATNGAVHLSGTGTPEGVITAAPGSTWLQTDSTTDVKGWIRWVKATGTGNTGWVAGPEADTGWRLVTAALGSASDLLVRRQGRLISVKSTTYTAPGGGLSYGTGFYSPPTGFRNTRQESGVGRNGTSGSVVVVTGDETYGLYFLATLAASDPVYFSLSYTTDDAWPTSLPGSAA